MHIAQELLDGLGEHQATPHQRRVLLDEEAGTDDLQQSLRQPASDLQGVGHDPRTIAAVHLLSLERLVDAQQTRHAEAPDVGIEHPDGETLRGDCGCEVHRDRTLPHAALAAGDGDHLAGEGHVRVGRVLAGVPAGLQHHVAALVAGHLAPLDPHVGDARVHGDAGFNILLDLGTERAAADRELDPNGDDSLGRDGHGRHHAQRDDVGAQFWINHGTQ